MNLKDFLLKIIDNQYYKKDILSINLIFAFLQMYFIKKINSPYKEIDYPQYELQGSQ